MVDEMAPGQPKILCPFCSHPWGNEQLDLYAWTTEGCSTCGWGGSATVDIKISCESCGRLMYEKEGVHAD